MIQASEPGLASGNHRALGQDATGVRRSRVESMVNRVAALRADARGCTCRGTRGAVAGRLRQARNRRDACPPRFNQQINLEPVNPEFEPIMLTGADDEDLLVISELV